MSDKKIEVSKEEESILLDHSYDGIQELDHVLPRWWVWLFILSIVYSIWYVGYYMVGNGPSPEQELAVAMSEIEAMKPAKSAHGSGEDALMAAFKDPAKLKLGAEVYQGKCVACHGVGLEGGIGPNLTDDFWLHGQGNLEGIAKVVNEGVLEKGMPAWGEILTPDETVEVVAYVHSMHGTNPANGKAPQGEKQEYKE